MPTRLSTPDPANNFRRPVPGPWDALWIWPVAAAVAVLSWWPLGIDAQSGLHGGDVYTYFFPLKAWYADRLAAGELPLWNPLVGHGFPALGESQTGVFYPLNLLFYRFLSLNQAYHGLFVLHYVLAFGFSCHYARRLGFGGGAAVLAAVAFVYGWFPARSCLEWAIVTGSWIPLAFWGAEVFLRTRRVAGLLGVQLALVMQLLAGHFHVAFITLLGLALYAPLRSTWSGAGAAESRRRLVLVAFAVAAALGVAAVQLVPSWELKERSQRESSEFGAQRVGYGRIPWSYLPQVVLPWRYYPHVNDAQFDQRFFGQQNTNKVEAHLYFGLVPMLLGVVGVVVGLNRWGDGWEMDGAVRSWLLIGLCGLGLATVDWARWGAALPGFGYFTGPGRYGVLVQLAVAVFAARGAESIGDWVRWGVNRNSWLLGLSVFLGSVVLVVAWRAWTSWSGSVLGWWDGGVVGSDSVLGISPEVWVVVVGFAGLAIGSGWMGRWDVWLVVLCVVLSWSDVMLAVQAVQYAERRVGSPINYRRESRVGAGLRVQDRNARVLARNQNSVTLCGVSAVPVYLGIGPREYFGGPLRVPGDFHWEARLSPAMRSWLAWSGVTHVLSFDAMEDESLEFLAVEYDPFLHDVLGRSPAQPLWIYAVRAARGRAYCVARGDAAAALDPGNRQAITFEQVERVWVCANVVELETRCAEESVVILTDLMYPGWSVTVDGRRQVPLGGGVFRAVAVPAGVHVVRWEYWPVSLAVGLGISVLSVAATGVLVWRIKNPAVRTRRDGGAGTEKRPTASGGHPDRSAGTPD